MGDSESILSQLMATIESRKAAPSESSYTSKLLAGGVAKIGGKITEEAAEVVEAADEPIIATRCEDGGPGCLGGSRCRTHDLWAELGEQIRLFLGGVTLADVAGGQVCGRARAPAGPEATRHDAP